MAKVVHLTSVHTPYDVRILEKQCQSLAAAGHDVVLVNARGKNEQRGDVRLIGVEPAKSRLRRMSSSVKQVFQIAKQENADVIHMHDPELLVGAKLFGKRGQKCIFDMHEDVVKDVMSKPWIKAWFQKPVAVGVRLLVRGLIGNMPVIFAEESYAKDFPWIKNYEIVQNMPRLGHFDNIEAKPKTEPRIGYMGAVSEDRGSLITLEALRLLKESGLKVGFDCVGPASHDEHADLLKQRTKEFGLEDVVFHGYKQPQQGWEIMSRCHIGLAVLKPKSYFMESYPTKMFEYMAMGLPVIVSDFPLYRNVVEPHQCGKCVSANDPAALAEAIRFFVTQPAERNAWGHRGKQVVATRYSWANEEKKLLAFYEQVLSS